MESSSPQQTQETVNVPVTSAPAPPYAGFWLRLIALIIDGIILGIAGGIINSFVYSLLGSGNIVIVVSYALFFLYHAYMESSSWQATLGKRALSLKVTDESGGRISFGRACGRTAGKILSGLILGIGYLMAAFTKRKQGLHDILAHTLVVKN